MQMPGADAKPMRFYHIILQQDLLGGWTLIKETGFQGGAGRVTKAHFDVWEDAETAMIKVLDAQSQKGYRVVFIDGHESPLS